MAHILGNEIFVMIEKEVSYAGIPTGDKYYWFEQAQFNTTPNVTTIPLKTNVPIKHPCQDRYGSFDYQVVLTGHIELQLLKLFLESFKGSAASVDGFGQVINSFRITQSQYGINPHGRIAKGCIVQNLTINYENDQYVTVDITFLSSHINQFGLLTPAPTNPTQTCPDYIKDASFISNMDVGIKPSATMTFETE